MLAVVAAVLVAAGPVAGSSGLGPQVARIVKTGVCIVAGDVCRPADAAAAGLAPCTLSERRTGGSFAVTIYSVRLGGGHQVSIARRSDGSWLVVESDDSDAGLSAGLGVTAGPVRLGIDGGAGLTIAKAKAWAVPDEAAVRRLLRLRDVDRPAPLWRSGDAGLATFGWAGLGVKGGDRHEGAGGGLFGAELSAEMAVGVRLGRGTTTYFFRAESKGPQLSDAFGHTVGARARGPVVVEYTRDEEGPHELAFRIAYRDPAKHETVETVARLDLRDPASRAVAGRLLRHRPPWVGEASDDLREAIRTATATGTVERSVYAVDDGSFDLGLAGRLGFEFGLEGGKTEVVRKLVDASAWTPGSRERAREDCLG